MITSDLGEFRQGQYVRGWIVELVTARKIVLRNGSETRTYPVPESATQPKKVGTIPHDRPPAPSAPVAPSTRPVDTSQPAPAPTQPLPAVIQVKGSSSYKGKIVVYSDLGELSAGQEVRGWKVELVTREQVLFSNGSTVHKCRFDCPHHCHRDRKQ